MTWGTGPGVLEPFVRRVRAHVASGRVTFRFRHRVTQLVITNGVVTGVTGEVLEPTTVVRGAASSRVVTGDFTLHAGAVIVTSGGIGGNPPRWCDVTGRWTASGAPQPSCCPVCPSTWTGCCRRRCTRRGHGW